MNRGSESMDTRRSGGFFEACDDAIRCLTVPEIIREYVVGDQGARAQLYLACANEVEAQDNTLKHFIAVLDSYQILLRRCDEARESASSDELNARERELSVVRDQLSSAFDALLHPYERVSAAQDRITKLIDTRLKVYSSLLKLSREFKQEFGKRHKSE